MSKNQQIRAALRGQPLGKAKYRGYLVLRVPDGLFYYVPRRLRPCPWSST